MSYKTSDLISDRVCGGSTRKIILLHMADRANPDGTGIWSSLQTIADWCEVNIRTVRRVLREFEEEGLIEAVGQRKCKNGFTTEYTLRIDAVEKLPLVGKTPDTTPARTSCPAVTKSPRTLSAGTPDTTPAKPTLEPTLSVSKETESRRLKKSSGPSEAFLALWREWAAKDEIKRSSRKPAWEAYARLVKDGADEDEIARGVRAFLADSRQTKEGGQFMKAFAVWLKNETWADWAHKPTPQKSTPPSPEQIWAPRYREWLRTDGLIWDFQQWGPAPDEEGHRGPKRFRENKQPQPQEQGVAA